MLMIITITSRKLWFRFIQVSHTIAASDFLLFLTAFHSSLETTVHTFCVSGKFFLFVASDLGELLNLIQFYD